jgi:hypothetical protein
MTQASFDAATSNMGKREDGNTGTREFAIVFRLFVFPSSRFLVFN